jgi:imidazolonepropionase-like amidohydrolase
VLALTGATVVDGTGQPPTRGCTVIIHGGVFAEVGHDVSCPADATVIDLNGLTVMPGLIDCHVHLGGLTVDKPGRAIGRVSFADMASFFWDYARNYSRRRRLAIENGVTTIRSAGDLYPHIIGLRDRIAAGSLPGPRIVAPGPTITAPGGHPASTIYRGNRYIVEHAIRQIADASTARDEVKRLAEGGVDCVKAIYSDIDPMDTRHRVPRLSLGVLEALADESHQHRLRLMVHTGGAGETLDAVRAGADSIEHGLLPGTDSTDFGDEVVAAMVERHTYFVPTLATAWAYSQTYPELFRALKETVKRLHEAGVMIAAGTDSGSPGVVIGRGLHKELELMAEVGFSPTAAIEAGTRQAAALLGKVAELGTVEPGKVADIIAVSGDPLKDIGDTKNVRLVIKDGKVVVNRVRQSGKSS